MALPAPERGLVISYAYVWQREHEQGREEGTKDRPCLIVLAVEDEDGICTVTVAPITHATPPAIDVAIEIPHPTKQRLGLDSARSWIIVSEANRFVWPGPDLRPIRPDTFAYGFVPPALLRQVQRGFAAYFTAKKRVIVSRTE